MRLWNDRFHRDSHSQLIFFSDFRIFHTKTVAAQTAKLAANVAKMVTTTVSPVLDETLQPRGLVLSSHLSSGCGHILLSKAGASIGIACAFGTHDHVCTNKRQYTQLTTTRNEIGMKRCRGLGDVNYDMAR
jgi:hypothetical protein